MKILEHIEEQLLMAATVSLPQDSDEQFLMHRAICRLHDEPCRHAFAVDEETGQLLGLLQCRAFPGLEDLHISNLVVMPAHQSSGIGTALIEKARQTARNEGFRYISAYPMTSSLPFCEKAGFTLDTETSQHRLLA